MRTHTGDKPFKCFMYGLCFARNSSCLKTHLRIHTGEKPFKCALCGLMFFKSGSLKSHICIHTGKRPFKCDVCGLRLSQSGSLKSHKGPHTGERPFKCDVCGLCFLDVVIWSVMCAFILGISWSNVTCVDYALLKIAVWSVICILERSPSNVKCVHCPLLNVDTWRVICALILGKNVIMGLVWIRFKGHSGTGELVQWRFSRSDNFKTHTRTHTWETSKCDICHSVVYAFPKILIWTCAFILGPKSFKCDMSGLQFSHSRCMKTHCWHSAKKHRILWTHCGNMNCNVCINSK